MSRLAYAMSVQFVCAHFVCARSSRGVFFGFYGDATCAMVAARTMVYVFNVVVQTATNHSWAQGFADKYYLLQKEMRHKMVTSSNKDRSMVLVEKKEALIAQVKAQMCLGKPSTAKRRGHHSDSAAYQAGQRAASSFVETEGTKRALL